MAQPTMEDVAKAAGVSRALVSLVMRGSPKVSDRSRAAVLEAADQLGYRPNLMARHLAAGRTMTIGVLLNDLHNPFFAETTDGIEEAAQRLGYQIVIKTARRSVDGERIAIESFLQFQTDGIVLVGPWCGPDEIDALATERPTVVVGRVLSSSAVDTINTDDELGARLVVEHLAELGHERIAHIDGGDGAGAEQRRIGYREAMTLRGLNANVQIIPGEYAEAAGAAGVDALLASGSPPTAIFAANDLQAAGALDRLEGSGLRVPDDVSLVGYDNTALAALAHMGLSTINQPTEVLGQLAISTLVERLDGQRSGAVHHTLAPSLIARDTSGPPPTITA